MRLEVFDNDQWADGVAQRWATFMQRKPAARICLPAGETPRPAYAVAASVLDLDAATVFILDEFDLPPDSGARCDVMLHRDLLDLLISQPKVVHRLDPAAPDPDAECRRYGSLIADGGLDLTLLGLGANGHVGLNEPGTAPETPTRVTRLASSTARAARQFGPDVEPKWGMTLGMRAILDSEEVWLLVTGSRKASILDRTLNGPIGPDIPATYLREHPNAVVFADRAAASG